MNSDASPASPPVPTSLAPDPDSGPDKRPAIPDTLPILPTRDVAVFPGIIASISIGRPSSRKLLEESLPQSKTIGVFAQRNSENDKPGQDDLYRVGVACSVHKLMRQPDDSGVLIVVSALGRIALKKVISTEPFLRGEIEVLQSILPLPENKQWQAMLQQLRESALELISHVPDAPAQAS